MRIDVLDKKEGFFACIVDGTSCIRMYSGESLRRQYAAVDFWNDDW